MARPFWKDAKHKDIVEVMRQPGFSVAEMENKQTNRTDVTWCQETRSLSFLISECHLSSYDVWSARRSIWPPRRPLRINKVVILKDVASKLGSVDLVVVAPAGREVVFTSGARVSRLLWEAMKVQQKKDCWETRVFSSLQNWACVS